MFYNLSSLRFTRVAHSQDAITAYAKYPEWSYEYSFIIKSDGKVSGKTSDGMWLELSKELSSFVWERVRQMLAH